VKRPAPAAKPPPLSPRTLENYDHALSEFRRRHKAFTTWQALTADDFRQYLFEQMKRELGRATIRLHFAALRSFYKWLTRRQGWKTNPLLDVQLPKQEKNSPSCSPSLRWMTCSPCR
jgi:integrase/recombinase XerC